VEQKMKNIFRISVGLAFLWLALNASAVAYWNCSSATGTASGTWNATNATWTGNTALFTYSPLGGPTDTNPICWTCPDPFDNNTVLQGNYAAAFSLGQQVNGFPSPYTITVDNTAGQVGAGDLLVYSGPMTLTGGSLDFINIINNSQSSTKEGGLVFTIHTNQTAYFNLNLTNSVGPFNTASINRNVFANKQGTGSLYLGAVNTFTGDIAVKSGVLGITVDHSIPSGGSLILLNGSDIGGVSDLESNTPPVFSTDGHNQTFDQLVLSGPNSLIPRIIDFGNGHGSLVFAGDSSTNAWQSTASPVFGDSNPGPLTLVVTNYQLGTSQLRFGTSSNGLTAAQLSQIRFADYTNAQAKIDSSGYVTPVVPQPVLTVQVSYTVQWVAISGTHYQVQYSSAANGTYTNLAVVLATSTLGSYTDVAPGASQRFYRVIQL
jgi:autotransporter-associated beta strand protein